MGRCQVLSYLASGLSGRAGGSVRGSAGAGWKMPAVEMVVARRAAEGRSGVCGPREGQARARWSGPRHTRKGLTGPGPQYGRAGDVSMR